MTESEAIKFCIQHGIEVLFYKDGAVNMSIPTKPIYGDHYINVFGASLIEGVTEAQVRIEQVEKELEAGKDED